MKSWKTTSLGVLTIGLAIGNAIYNFLSTGAVPNIAALSLAVTTGAGLIAAKDHNVTNAPTPVAAKSTDK